MKTFTMYVSSHLQLSLSHSSSHSLMSVHYIREKLAPKALEALTFFTKSDLTATTTTTYRLIGSE